MQGTRETLRSKPELPQVDRQVQGVQSPGGLKRPGPREHALAQSGHRQGNTSSAEAQRQQG